MGSARDRRACRRRSSSFRRERRIRSPTERTSPCGCSTWTRPPGSRDIPGDGSCDGHGSDRSRRGGIAPARHRPGRIANATNRATRSPRPGGRPGRDRRRRAQAHPSHPLLAPVARRHLDAPRGRGARRRAARPPRAHGRVLRARGEMTFRIGPDLESSRRRRNVRRRAAQRRPRLRQRQLRAVPLPELPRAERRLRRLPARREPRVRQLRPPEDGESPPDTAIVSPPGEGERLARGNRAHSIKAQLPHLRRSSSPSIRAGRASTRTRTTITWTRSSSSKARPSS